MAVIVPPTAKKAATSAWSATQCVMVHLSDILVWPIEMEPGSKEWAEGLRIPYAALNYLRDVSGIDLSLPAFTFADRGKIFYEQVMWRLHQQQQPRP